MLTTTTLARRLFGLIKADSYELDYDRSNGTDVNVWDTLTMDAHDAFSRRVINDVLEQVSLTDGADEMNEEQLFEAVLNGDPEFYQSYTADLLGWMAESRDNLAEVEEALDERGWTRGATFGLIVQTAQQKVGERIAQHVCRTVVWMLGDEFDPYPEEVR